MNSRVAQAVQHIINNECDIIDLRNAGVNNESIRHISEALRHNNTVTKLNLCQNDITSDGMRYLAKALITNRSIISLNISFNNIGDEGFQHLCNTLESNKSISALFAGKCNISNQGARYVALALRSNILTDVYLCGNQISNIQHLAESLTNNCSLTDLDIRGSGIYYREILPLLQGLKYNSSLIRFGITVNNVTLLHLSTRESCLSARNKIYIFLFCDMFTTSPLCDRTILFKTLQYLLTPCDVVPSYLYE